MSSDELLAQDGVSVSKGAQDWLRVYHGYDAAAHCMVQLLCELYAPGKSGQLVCLHIWSFRCALATAAAVKIWFVNCLGNQLICKGSSIRSLAQRHTENKLSNLAQNVLAHA